jgi:perosamine synthetase
MLGRWQPPVIARVSARALGQSFGAAMRRDADVPSVRRALEERFDARAVALTDSGTSALVLAFRFALPAGGTVALPAYACVDLLAASAYAGLEVRLYDIDPETLSPDLDSVTRAVARGVDAIVVAHLFGFPADVPGVASIAEAHGVPVIEDAAQQAGGTLHDRRLGAFGPLAILSFGRGKGLPAGGGGAIMANTGTWSQQIHAWEASVPTPRRAGWREWVTAAGIWAVGRPSVYGIPASIPALGIGETIYKEAHEPERLSNAGVALAGQALAEADADGMDRVARARQLAEALGDVPGLCVVRPIANGTSGYLRLPVLDRLGRRAAPRLGVVRSYPRALGEEPAAKALLASREPPTPGAVTICKSLFTLPTHANIDGRDREQILRWARGSRSQ